MLKLGELNTLTALRQTDNGIYLIDEESNEVLLPNKYIPDGFELENTVEVFLYKDSEDRIVATTLTPKIMLNGYAALEAIDVSDNGAFFDWGLEKDLMVPYVQQVEPVEKGDFYVVYLYLDEKSERLVGTTKISNTLEKDTVDLKIGDKVDLLPYDESEIGISVIVNKMYQGMLFKNEVFEEIMVGDELTGYVKKIRDDNKIDVSLNRFGYRAVDDNVEKLVAALKANEGFLNLNDKSSPEDISEKLGLSKKVFKKVVGALYKQKRLEISGEGIKLIEINH
ncbi:MAG: GntR family transcriptional regulator [Bacteroidetes bacterium]|nr:MAG: GntR family transcriptional regulator [Bacteroidota bacterium]